MAKCDCLDCYTISTWKQAFVVDNKTVVVNLCKEHHDVLRFKVPVGQPLNEDVLKWLLKQPSNFRKAVRYDISVSLRNVAKKAVENKQINEEGIVNG